MAGIPEGMRSSDMNIMYSKSVKPADISRDTTDSADKTTRTRSSGGTRSESYSIESLLAKAQDSDLADAYGILSRSNQKILVDSNPPDQRQLPLVKIVRRLN